MGIFLKYIIIVFFLCHSLFAQGVNLIAQEELDARYSGLAGVHLGFKGKETALSSHPVAIQDIEQLWFSTQYINRFSSLLQQNNFAFGLPLDAFSTLALGFVYFGGEFVARANFFDTPKTQSFYDFLFVIAYARRLNFFDIGANAKIIYRQLDQVGLGIQADVSMRYFLKHFQFDMYLRGLVPSSVRWNETELVESDIPEIFLSTSFHNSVNAIYGNYTIVLQTQGFIQNSPKSIESQQGGNIGDPESLLKTLKLAAELELDGGLALRFGISEIFNLIRFDKLYPNYGIGYSYKNYFKVDYSFHLHPELETTHAISLSVSPWWVSGGIKRPYKKVLGSRVKIKTEIQNRSKILNLHLQNDDLENQSSEELSEEEEEEILEENIRRN